MNVSKLRGRIATFLREARRRRVYTAALAYIGIAVVLTELGGALFDAFLFPPVASRILTVLLLLGFPIVLVLAWIFDIGPAGLLRTDAPALQNENFSHHGGGSWAPPIPDEEEPSTESPVLADEAPDPERVRRAALANIRHELRTPINAIMGYGEMLLEDAQAEGDTSATADLERVVAGGRTLLTLIDEILGADRVSADVGRDLESYAAQVRADLRDPLSAINGYAEMLIESSSEGGHSSRLPDLERILTASRKLLDLSNDIVQVAAGAQGEVHGLARASSMAEGVLSKIRRIDADAHDERQGSLLVVDDNAMNRDLLARQLARKGYLVATAEHGLQALDRMAEQEFDVVLLDVMMPEMDGIEVLRRMKADPRLREVPVIMISALDEIDSVIRCLEIGASDFLSKPFHPTLLDARIGASLAVRRIRQREAQLRAAVRNGEAPLDRLAESTIPASVLVRLRRGETRVFDASTEATVLWCDVDRAIAARTDPQDRAARVDALCTLVFEAARTLGVESVLHRGNGLLLACGFPSVANKSAERIAEAASMLLERAPAIANAGLRLGVHTGPMYGAVVGGERLSYWIWGDAVDLARRLAADAEANQAHVSPAAHALLKDRFTLTSRGVVDVAGRGQLRTWAMKAPAAVAAGS